MGLVTSKPLEVGEVYGEPSDSGIKSRNGNWTPPCHCQFNVKFKGDILIGLVDDRVSFV